MKLDIVFHYFIAGTLAGNRHPGEYSAWSKVTVNLKARKPGALATTMGTLGWLTALTADRARHDLLGHAITAPTHPCVDGKTAFSKVTVDTMALTRRAIVMDASRISIHGGQVFRDDLDLPQPIALHAGDMVESAYLRAKAAIGREGADLAPLYIGIDSQLMAWKDAGFPGSAAAVAEELRDALSLTRFIVGKNKRGFQQALEELDEISGGHLPTGLGPAAFRPIERKPAVPKPPEPPAPPLPLEMYGPPKPIVSVRYARRPLRRWNPGGPGHGQPLGTFVQGAGVEAAAIQSSSVSPAR